VDKLSFEWDDDKNEFLKNERNMSFEKITVCIRDDLLDIISNPSANHQDQKCFVVDIDGYAWVVPYTEDGEKCFLKTAFPSRKFQKNYLDRRGKK
jgi:uncharacterized DUF497 family protein